LQKGWKETSGKFGVSSFVIITAGFVICGVQTPDTLYRTAC